MFVGDGLLPRIREGCPPLNDEQLATMLDSGAYALEALERPTRLAIKRFGLAVSEQLV